MKKVALITGASSGIGREMAKIHAAKGGDLVVVARSENKLKELKEDLESKHKGIAVHVVIKNLNGADAAKEVYDEVKRAGVSVDYLINNAGFGGQGYFHERRWEDDLLMMNLNMVALTALTRFYLPEMVARNEGRILNVSSTASLLPGPLQSVYYATKAYVTSFSNGLVGELEGTNVTVSALLPGATDTGFAKTSGMDKTELFSNTFSADVVAKAGYEGMLQGKMNIMAGLTGSQKALMYMLPFIPKKMLLKQIKAGQEVK